LADFDQVVVMPRIDSCLFGYEDGHRLLASSMKIDGESASQLTLLSDLAPGARFGLSDGYWTGFPLPKLDRYALMRTWPAPEMSRPGCVWTHAMLFETSLFEDVEDLSSLKSLARRPHLPDDLSFYGQPIDSQMVGSSLSHYERSLISIDRATEILENLYSEGTAISVEKPGDLEDEIFAIWSQQWPRLRRNFRFQTMAGDDIGTARSPFDLRLLWRHAANLNTPISSIIEKPSWLDAAATDLIGMSNHSLRRFLWRYGKDVRKQRGSFKPLCEIFSAGLGTKEGLIHTDLGHSLSNWFPTKDDASTLKSAIVDGEVLPDCQLRVLSYLLKEDITGSLPLPSPAGIDRLANFWPEATEQMLDLAEYAVSEDSELANSVTGIVLSLIPASNFWTVTQDFPKVRKRMIRNKPDFLDADEISALDSQSLLELIKLVPIDDPVGSAITHKLLLNDNYKMADAVLEHFPSHAARELISEAANNDSRTLREWFRAMSRRPSLVLDPKITSGVRRTSTLYRIGEDLGWLAPDVLRASTAPWVAALIGARNDLSREEGDILGSFLIALAILSGDRGSQDIFEKCFDEIHKRILQSYLPWRASDILLPRLPSLSWRRNWDTGLRLRLGVANAYIRNQLDTDSFASLTRDKRAREMLADAAKELDGGERYAASIVR
jgi:hypothetical protein